MAKLHRAGAVWRQAPMLQGVLIGLLLATGLCALVSIAVVGSTLDGIRQAKEDAAALARQVRGLQFPAGLLGGDRRLAQAPRPAAENTQAALPDPFAPRAAAAVFMLLVGMFVVGFSAYMLATLLNPPLRPKMRCCHQFMFDIITAAALFVFYLAMMIATAVPRSSVYEPSHACFAALLMVLAAWVGTFTWRLRYVLTSAAATHPVSPAGGPAGKATPASTSKPAAHDIEAGGGGMERTGAAPAAGGFEDENEEEEEFEEVEAAVEEGGRKKTTMELAGRVTAAPVPNK